MIATITFNPSIDQHIIVPDLVKDDANRAISLASYPGGKGANVSKVVRELKGRTRAYALIGGFTGDFWEDRIKNLRIDYSASRIHGETRINTILTDLKDRTQTRISAPGPRLTKKDINRFLKKLLAVRPKPFLWALGGSLPSNTDPSTYKIFIEALQKNGTPCVLDADDEALRLGLMAKPFMIKPNEHEIKRLLGRDFKTMKDYLKGARELVKKGIRVVVVSLGSEGAIFVTKSEAFHIPGIPIAVKSKVGAGDSLIGGMTLELSRKKSLRQAARVGVAASTSAVMREAPRLCLFSDIQRLLKRIRIEDL